MCCESVRGGGEEERLQHLVQLEEMPKKKKPGGRGREKTLIVQRERAPMGEQSLPVQPKPNTFLHNSKKNGPSQSELVGEEKSISLTNNPKGKRICQGNST